jgi:hypothetical protein
MAIEIDDATVVARTDEPLHPIWWRGYQWAVTEYGIERLDGTYAIEASRLREDMPDTCWPDHMAEKRWVNVPEFITAWLVAIALHGSSTDGVRDVIAEHLR